MAVCKYIVIFIGSNALYAGGIDESLEEATLPTSAGRHSTSGACRLDEDRMLDYTAFTLPLPAGLRLSNSDGRGFHRSMEQLGLRRCRGARPPGRIEITSGSPLMQMTA